MKYTQGFFVIAILISTTVMAERMLEASEVQRLLEQLCKRQATRWIEQGRIEARHRFSDMTTGEVMITLETVTTDGDRFVWDTRMDDASKIPLSREAAKDFIEWNRHRTFVWDGTAYTLYFQPGNHAIIHEEPSVPVHVNGPLTAGVIPWGKGQFAYERLSAGELSSRWIQDDLLLELSIGLDDLQMQFVLDSQKDYAVDSFIYSQATSKTVQTYGNYIRQQGKWIPMNILIDRYQNDQLHSSDTWEIITVEDDVPLQGVFRANLRDKAMVEYSSPLLDKPSFYRYSKRRNIDSLLDKRFMAAMKKQKQKQNCATVATENILSEFGIQIESIELDALVGSKGATSLYQIKQFVEQKGLFCLPVKTDLPGLQRHKNAQILVHFPEKKHFVLLDRIEKDVVWLIDLDRQTFYHCMDMKQFKQNWAGIALVVSDKPLVLGSDDKPIPDPILQNIKGAADYSCSELIQEYDIHYCPEMFLNLCGGRYIMWYERYACEVDSSKGGYCDGAGVVGSVYSTCVVDTVNLGSCTTTGNYYSRYLRACQP